MQTHHHCNISCEIVNDIIPIVCNTFYSPREEYVWVTHRDDIVGATIFYKKVIELIIY